MAARILGKARTVALATVALAALAGCGSSDAGSSTAAGSSGTAADLAVAESALGRIVVDGQKMTAYYFTKDTPNSGRSACTGPCLQAWPPITTTSSNPSVSGVTGQVGTIALADGSRQLTVNGRPLYLFAKDSKAGDVLGQGVGGVWYVLRPDGTMVTDKPSNGPATPAY